MLIQTKVVDFNKIISVIKEAGRSSESLAPEIGLTPNGLRKTLKNHTLTLATYEKLAKVLKIHPAFIFDQEGDCSDYFYKKNPAEIQLSIREIEKLHRELKALKEKNMNLQSRLIEMLDDRKKPKN